MKMIIKKNFMPSNWKEEKNYPHELLQTLAVVDVANFLAQQYVQYLADGPAEGRRYEHRQLRQVYRFSAHAQTVSAANGLK